MKNLKIIFAAFLMMAFAMNLNAQITIGARGGLTLATYNTDPIPENFLGDQDMKYMAGVDAAIFSNFEITENFSIQPEFHFVQKGVKFTGKDATDNMDLKMTYRFNYLELPVLARFNFINPSENVVFYLAAGPSVGYGLNGTYKGENVSLEANEGGIRKGDFEMDLEWDDEYGIDGTKSNRWDIGGVAGFGVEFLTDVVNVVLDTRYNMDFTDAVKYENTPSPEPDKIYNRGFSFTVGVAFPIGN